MPVPLPPLELPELFDVQRSSSPVEDDDGPAGYYEGLELTVFGLERKSVQSAADHLRRLLNELVKATPDMTAEGKNFFKALKVRPADTRNAYDYAYISLDQEMIPQPRADLLQTLRKSLMEAFAQLRVSWRVHAGLDKTRRLTFAMDSQKQAQEVGPKLNEWLERKGYPVLLTYTSHPGGTWRITYDFLKFDDVEAVFSSPPVIGGRTFYPNRPRFIIPSYAFQIAVLGCRDWQSAKGTLDRFIRQFCERDDGRDPVVYSRMELGGDVYTAVLQDWTSTVRVAEGFEPLRDFLSRDVMGRHINPVPQPGLLYGMNGSGLFFRQGATSPDRSLELQQLRHELDAVRQQGLEHIQTIFSALARTNEAIASMGTRLDNTLAGMANLAARQALDAQVLQLELSMSDLRQERNQCQLVILLGDRVPSEMQQANLVRMRQCDEDLAERRRKLEELRKQQGAVTFNNVPTPPPEVPRALEPPPSRQLQRSESAPSVGGNVAKATGPANGESATSAEDPKAMEITM